MGILERLGGVLKSYATDFFDDITGSADEQSARRARGAGLDADLNAAYEELDAFLEGRGGPQAARAEASGGADRRSRGAAARTPPAALRADFAELGVAFAASPEVCKAAYKRLLKQYHPDRHAGDSEEQRRATEKTARLNAAWSRIHAWSERGA